MELQFADIVKIMNNLLEDNTIPRNVRKNITEARDHLKSDEEGIVKAGAAIYSLESISDDINLPVHARTQIWTILSALESIKAD